MNDNFKKCSVVKNQSGHIFSFYLNKSGNIMHNYFGKDNESITKDKLVARDVIEFSVSIDKLDHIHLVSLNNLGELSYLTFINDLWSNKVIRKLDLRSNNYKYLNLLIFDDSVGFLYSYSNLINPSVWNIDYISIKPNYEKKNIISILAGMDFSAYSVCVDTFNNIHLLYRATENRSSQIYYMKFSPFLNIYNRAPIMISDNKENNFHPYIFIDTKSQIHALWTQVSCYSSIIECMVMAENDSKFRYLNLPTLQTNASHPIIFEESNVLKIIYLSNNSLSMASSKDYSLNWSQSDSIDLLDNSLYLSRYSSNYSEDKDIYNINYVYAFINTNIDILFSDSFKNDLIELDLREEVLDSSFTDFCSNLSVSSIDSHYMDDAIDDTEQVLSSLLIKLDDNLVCHDNYSKSIEKVEIKLNEYKDKNSYLIKLLNSLNTYHGENSKTIARLEDDLGYLKESLDKKNNSFLRSLFSKFR